jgi:hypothetical protein
MNFIKKELFEKYTINFLLVIVSNSTLLLSIVYVNNFL